MSDKIVKAAATVKPPIKKVTAARATAVKKAPATKARAPVKTVAGKTSAEKKVLEKKPKKAGKSGNKIKVVRDSFTMPQSDYAKIGELKQLCVQNGMHVKKSELLRAGLHALGKLSIGQLKTALSALEAIKTGRPKKNGNIASN